MTTRRTLVVGAWLIGVAGAVALLFAAGTATGLTGGQISPIFVWLALAVVTDACVGAGLVLRRPGNMVGLLLLAAAVVIVITFVGFFIGATLTEQRGRQDVLAGLASLFGDVIQGRTVAVAASTLLAAALFQPLRRRVQTAVDHRFNRARYDAERTAADFAERLRDEVDVDHLRTTLTTTAGGAVDPTGVGVWLRPTPGTTR